MARCGASGRVRMLLVKDARLLATEQDFEG
jgi:hypothetical protein